jgi:hypothetical protein
MEASSKKMNGHSRLTNRMGVADGAQQFLEEVDHRTRAARRYKDICEGLARHLGGEEGMSETRRHLSRRAAALIVWCEAEESKLVVENNEIPPFDPAIYATACNSLRRLLLDLGLNPALKDVTPDLQKYLHALIDAEDADVVIDASVADAEDEDGGEQTVRFDNRGRARRGSPEQVAAASRMREVAKARRAEREAEQKRVLKAAVIGARKLKAREEAKAKTDDERS